MSTLTEAAFTDVVRRGCLACGSRKLSIRTYVPGLFPIMDGESDGTVLWAYKGEHFVDGVFEIRCAACKKDVFADDRCPRCHTEDALPKALATANRHPVPRACPKCGDESVTYRAYVPASVTYDGKPVGKPRPEAHLEEPGFHGLSTECSSCGRVDERGDACPLCAAPGPIRS